MQIKTYPICKALLIGVSQYQKNSNLAASEWDVEAFQNALQENCFIPPRSIEVISGQVEYAQFDRAFATFCDHKTEIKIVYFSGHGQASGDGMSILFSDDRLESISYVMREAAKNTDSLWVIVDACQSGGAKPPRNDRTIELDAPFGYGITYFAACAENECAWAAGNSRPSNFTEILRIAISAAYDKTRGCTKMNRIEQTVRLMAARRNEQQPSFAQHPIIRHDITGSIEFRNPTFHDYAPTRPKLSKSDGFRIASIEPCHTSLAQRNMVVVQTAAKSEMEIASLLPEVIRFGNSNQVFDSIIQDRNHRGKPIDMVFVYIAHSEEDVTHHVYSYRAVWMRHDNPSFHWGKWVAETKCWIEKLNCYEQIHNLVLENSIDDKAAFHSIQKIYGQVEPLSKSLFKAADEYENGSITEGAFLETLIGLASKIRDADNCAGRVGFTNDRLKNLVNLLMGLTNDLMNIMLIYSPKGMEERNPENRLSCLRIYKNTYLEDSRQFKLELEELLSHADDMFHD